MGELNPDMFDEEDIVTKGGRRERIKLRLKKREKTGPTASDRRQRTAEIQAAREARLKEARERIQSQLRERHFSTETREKEERLLRYIEWVEDSLSQGYPLIKEDDLKFKGVIASVKAGGQHRQRKRSAVRVTHLSTSFSAKNEEERNFQQNKTLARKALYRNLEDHLKLWQTMIKNSTAPVDVTQMTMELLATEITNN